MESSDIVTASSASVTDGTGPDPRRWGILAVVMVAQLMVVLDASIVNIALPSAQMTSIFRRPTASGSSPPTPWHSVDFLLLVAESPTTSGRETDVHHRAHGFRRRFRPRVGWPSDEAMLFAARALQGGFAAPLAPAALST